MSHFCWVTISESAWMKHIHKVTQHASNFNHLSFSTSCSFHFTHSPLFHTFYQSSHLPPTMWASSPSTHSSRPVTPSCNEEQHHEIEVLMMSSPPASDSDDIRQTGLDEASGEQDIGPIQQSSMPTLVHCNDHATMQRLISQAKLSPYQWQSAEAFCTVGHAINVLALLT